MPSQLLHTLFGEDVTAGIYRRLESRFGVVAGKALEKIQDTHKKAFVLGCQGPDIFYHSQHRRPVALEYGTLLHRRGVGVFTSELLKRGLPDSAPDEDDVRNRRREKGISALGAYALGFMTHAILDRLTHPYIVYKSDRPPPVSARRDRSHAFLERIIDVLMLDHLRKADVLIWDQEGMLAVPCEDLPPGLMELLRQALVKAYPERAGKDEKLIVRIENTFLDCAFFYRATAPANTPVKTRKAMLAIDDDFIPMSKGYVAYLYPEKLPARIDFLNLKKRPWYYPAGEKKEDLRSFPELYQDAVEAATDSLSHIIGRYLHEGSFPIREAAGILGNGGLSIVDDAGKPCALSWTDPLPLQKVLDKQVALRGL